MGLLEQLSLEEQTEIPSSKLLPEYLENFIEWYGAVSVKFVHDKYIGVEEPIKIYDRAKDMLETLPPIDPFCLVPYLPKEEKSACAGYFMSAAFNLTKQSQMIIPVSTPRLDGLGFRFDGQQLVNYAILYQLGAFAQKGTITNYGTVRDLCYYAQSPVIYNHGEVERSLLSMQDKGNAFVVNKGSCHYLADSCSNVTSINFGYAYDAHPWSKGGVFINAGKISGSIMTRSQKGLAINFKEWVLAEAAESSIDERYVWILQTQPALNLNGMPFSKAHQANDFLHQLCSLLNKDETTIWNRLFREFGVRDGAMLEKIFSEKFLAWR